MQWFLAHPWLTFFLALAAMVVILEVIYYRYQLKLERLKFELYKERVRFLQKGQCSQNVYN